MKFLLIRLATETEEYDSNEGVRIVKKLNKHYSRYTFPSSWTGISPCDIFDGYILSKCLTCKELQLLSFQNVSVDATYERQMGYEIQYSSSIEAVCDNCGVEDNFRDIAFYEYPESEIFIDDISFNEFEVNLCCTDYISLLFDNIDLLDEWTKTILKNEILEAQKIKNNSDIFKLKIKKLKQLVKDPNTTEREFQQFFEQNYWMFGVEYIEAISQEKISDKDIPDFLLKKYDEFYDILDLKLPIPKLFKNIGNKRHPRHELSEGCSQIENYIDYSIENTKKIEDDMQKRIYRPQGILVIGRSDISEKDRLQRFNYNHSKVKIMTYDDVIQKATNLIDKISNCSFNLNIK